MELGNGKKYLSFKYLRENRRINYSKLSPERIHNLFKEVDIYSQKLSPSNCSKSILALNSNIDAEIENAKNLGTPKLLGPTISIGSLSPNKNRIFLPKLNIIPSKNNNFEEKSVIDLMNYPKSTQGDYLPKTKYQSGRISKIDKIIDECSGLKKKVALIKLSQLKSHLQNESSALSSSDEEKEFKKEIVERCRKNFSNIKYSEEDTIKMAQALKRGKKVWKLNHLSFMKNVDRIMNSIKSSKK